MAFVAIISLLAGYALGIRYSVYAVAPVTAALLVLVIAIIVVSGASLVSALAAAIIGAVSLQFGYLSALIFRTDATSKVRATAVPSAADT